MAKKAWRLIFAEGLLGNYLPGEPVWSFRKYSPGSHEFTIGQIIEGHFKDEFMQKGGLRILLEVIETTKIKPFRDITQEECVLWGAECSDDMMEQMRDHYPDLSLDDTAALICTRIARIDDRPVAGPLPEGL